MNTMNLKEAEALMRKPTFTESPMIHRKEKLADILALTKGKDHDIERLMSIMESVQTLFFESIRTNKTPETITLNGSTSLQQRAASPLAKRVTIGNATIICTPCASMYWKGLPFFKKLPHYNPEWRVNRMAQSTILFRGMNFTVCMVDWAGVQKCPFCAETGCRDFLIINQSTKNEMAFSTLSLHLLDKHRFIQSPQSKYFLNIEKMLNLFG